MPLTEPQLGKGPSSTSTERAPNSFTPMLKGAQRSLCNRAVGLMGPAQQKPEPLAQSGRQLTLHNNQLC